MISVVVLLLPLLLQITERSGLFIDSPGNISDYKETCQSSGKKTFEHPQFQMKRSLLEKIWSFLLKKGFNDVRFNTMDQLQSGQNQDLL
jgi:hypothetical protein